MKFPRADGIELQQLAGKVFIRRGVGIVTVVVEVVEPNQHGGLFRNVGDELLEIPERIVTDGLDIVLHRSAVVFPIGVDFGKDNVKVFKPVLSNFL